MIDSLYDNFKHWSETGSVYIISDTHFDDPDCIFMDPSWPSAQEQFDLIKRTVHRDDTLIHLGDVGNVGWIKKLNCYKVLITGNHDAGKKIYLRNEEYLDQYPSVEVARQAVRNGEIDCYERILGIIVGKKDNKLFDEVYEGPLMIGEKILLSHEPVYGLDWCVNIHGHDHGDRSTDWNHLNLASNVCNYTPINLGALIKNGLLKNITTIHRITIDRATKNKKERENEIESF